MGPGESPAEIRKRISKCPQGCKNFSGYFLACFCLNNSTYARFVGTFKNGIFRSILRYVIDSHLIALHFKTSAKKNERKKTPGFFFVDRSKPAPAPTCFICMYHCAHK